MVARVTEVAQKAFGGKDKCQVLPFGSQVTGLCLPRSDIDFVIRFPTADAAKKNSKTKTERKSAKKTRAEDNVDTNGDNVEVVDVDDEESEEDLTSNPLERFADAVRDEFGIRSEFEADESPATEDDDDHNNNTEEGSNDSVGGKERGEHLSYLEVITRTRVPLVKFTVSTAANPAGIDVDACFDQPHGPESASLIHRFMESMPPLRPLTFVLKYFLASRDINKPYGGGVGSYLLQLMIVSFLQHRAREDTRWGRDRRRGGETAEGGSSRHYNLGSLLLDFFEFYGVDFNYVTAGISVRHDGFYFAKGGAATAKNFWNSSKPFGLAVENPLDPAADVGGGAFRMQMIRRVFEHAFKTLLAYVSEPAAGEVGESILAMIIPPTEEMERRSLMKMMEGSKRDGSKDLEDEDDDVVEVTGVVEGVGRKKGNNGNKKPKRNSKSTKRNSYDKGNNKKGEVVPGGWRKKEEEKKKRRRDERGGGISKQQQRRDSGGSNSTGKSSKNKHRKKERYSK